MQTTAFLLIKMQKVVALAELIGELGERHSLLRFTAETLLYRIFRHHVVDSDVLAYIADEVKKREILHPVIIVDHLGGIWCG